MIELMKIDDTYQPSFLKQTDDSQGAIVRLKAVFETATDGIIIIDHHGNIDELNPAAAKLFGYPAHELLGKNVSVLMPSPHKESHDSYIQRYLKSGVPKIIGVGREVQGLRKDGTLFPMRLAVGEVPMDNGEVLFTGIIHDMTEMKKVEDSLRLLNHDLERLVEARTNKLKVAVNKLLHINHKYEAEIKQRKIAEQTLRDSEDKLLDMLEKQRELNDLKSRFVSMASHEFKTPLSTILSSTALIARYGEGSDFEKQKKHIQRIKSSVKYLDSILSDFLSLSKLEESEIKVNLSEFNLADLIDEVKLDMRGSLKEGQEIIYDESVKDKILHTDQRILKGMLFNLISNASKYADEGTTILCTHHMKEQRDCVSIIDQGMGIPPEDQKYLFTRFFRATNAINIRGTGLGLYIVKKYAEALEANIEVDSATGKGSTFTIKFKLRE